MRHRLAQTARSWLAALSLGLAGCAALTPAKPVEPRPLETSDSATTRTFLELAEIREDSADWRGALAKLDKALAGAPRSQSALLRRAQILLLVSNATGMAPDLDEVQPILTEAEGSAIAAAEGGEDADLLLARAWLDVSEGRNDAAAAGAQRAAEVGADDARTLWMAARIQSALGDSTAALENADRATARDPQSHAAVRERARARLHLADFEGAALDLGTQLRAHGDDMEARALEGETFWRLGSFPSSSHAYEQIPSERRNAASHAALGWLALGADQPDAARSALEAGLAGYPSDAQLLDALLALDLREKRVGESLTRLDAAVAARPSDSALARVRARAFAAGNHHDDAAKEFGRAISLAPNDAATYEALATWLAKAKPEDADRHLAALAVGPAPTHVAQGSLRAARGDRSGAIDAYTKAVAEDPALPVARSALARALATSGQQLDRAVSLAREARAARPHDPDVAWSLGLVLLKRGQGKDSFEVLREAIGTYPVERPGFDELAFTTAQALESAGERDFARNAATVALAHAGSREPAPTWKPAAKALVARLEPPPPVESPSTPATEAAAQSNPPTAEAAPPADAEKPPASAAPEQVPPAAAKVEATPDNPAAAAPAPLESAQTTAPPAATAPSPGEAPAKAP